MNPGPSKMCKVCGEHTATHPAGKPEKCLLCLAKSTGQKQAHSKGETPVRRDRGRQNY